MWQFFPTQSEINYRITYVWAHLCFLYLQYIFILQSLKCNQSAIRSWLRVADYLSTTSRWKTSPSVFPNNVISKLAGLFSTLFLSCLNSSREAVNINFKVIVLTALEIEPKFTASEVDARSTGLFECNLDSL